MYEVIFGKLTKTSVTSPEGVESVQESYNPDARRVMVVAKNVLEAIEKAKLQEGEVAESVARHHEIDAV